MDIDDNGDRFSSVTAFDTHRWFHVVVTVEGGLATFVFDPSGTMVRVPNCGQSSDLPET